MTTFTIQTHADPHALAIEAEAAMEALVGLLRHIDTDMIELEGFQLAMLADPIRQKLTTLRLCIEHVQDSQPNDDEVTKP